MRLNGWQRIGIVASVCWLVGGGFWINGLTIGQLSEPVVNELRSCLESRSIQPDGSVPRNTDWGPCNEKFKRDYGPAVADHWFYAAAFTLIPIPLVWLIVYGIVWLSRWIRVGFSQQEE
jgi:hypothetical protein